MNPCTRGLFLLTDYLCTPPYTGHLLTEVSLHTTDYTGHLLTNYLCTPPYTGYLPTD